ncbi:MAG: HEAT repeat domain-containing protein [Synechococcus sp.]
MYLQQIATLLDSSDPQQRMKGITELRHHEPEDAVPLLVKRMYDKEFLIRSCVAMGLGHTQPEEGYEALLEIVARETDSNVIAEAANALAKFGERSLPHLEIIFNQHPHWLVRQSIFAALEDFDNLDVLSRLCRTGTQDPDPVVRQIAYQSLKRLSGTQYEESAQTILLQAAESKDAETRANAARSLAHFDTPAAKASLATLRKDPDHQVIAATLEPLV